jgi:hypothetical protein
MVANDVDGANWWWQCEDGGCRGERHVDGLWWDGVEDGFGVVGEGGSVV